MTGERPAPDGARQLEQLWRDCAPRVLAALVRRYGDFDTAEDALQEALLAASRQWPGQGVPSDPTAWLITVASRRLVDQWRADRSRVERERLVLSRTPPEQLLAPAVDSATAAAVSARAVDDSVVLLLLCCHMVDGPAAGLRMLDPLLRDDRLRRSHRLHAVRAHLLELDGRGEQARDAYATAGRLATSIPEQRYLNAAAARLATGPASTRSSR